jgi:molybdate transport system substrate-binding protein
LRANTSTGDVSSAGSRQARRPTINSGRVCYAQLYSTTRRTSPKGFQLSTVNFQLSTLVVCVLAIAISAPVHADTLRVAAAANLQQVFTEALLPAYEKASGDTVTPTYGSTKLLATQIEQGAPVDVFVAADKATVDRLAKSGVVDGATEQLYAIGQLVLWTRADAVLHPARVEDLSDPRYAHIAIANPDLAPYGKAAMESIDHAQLTDVLKPRIVQAENIAQALQFASSGNADVAFTALSLVIEDKHNPYIIVPASYHAPIVQAAAIVKGAADAAAAGRFMAFLVGPAARPIWAQYGYEAP